MAHRKVALLFSISVVACAGARGGAPASSLGEERSAEDWRRLDAVAYRVPEGFRDESHHAFASWGTPGQGRHLDLRFTTLPHECGERQRGNAVTTQRTLGERSVLVCQTDGLDYSRPATTWSAAIELGDRNVCIVSVHAERADTSAIEVLYEVVSSATPAHAPWSRRAPPGYVRRTMSGLDANMPSWVTAATHFRLVGPANASLEMYLVPRVSNESDDVGATMGGGYNRGPRIRVDEEARGALTIDGHEGRSLRVRVASDFAPATVEQWGAARFGDWRVLLYAQAPAGEADALKRAWDELVPSIRLGPPPAAR
jgi:hypothetical protein